MTWGSISHPISIPWSCDRLSTKEGGGGGESGFEHFAWVGVIEKQRDGDVLLLVCLGFYT